MNNKYQYGSPVNATNSGSSAAAAAIAGVASTTVYVTDITGSSDLASATITVKDGSNVIWQDRIGNTGAYGVSFNSPLACTAGNSATVSVTGTSACNANLSGFTIQP